MRSFLLAALSALAFCGTPNALATPINRLKNDESIRWTYESDINSTSEHQAIPSEWKSEYYGTTETNYAADGFITIGNTKGGIKHLCYKNTLNKSDFLIETDAKLTQVSDTSNNAVVGFTLSTSSNTANPNYSTQITYVYVGVNGYITSGSYFSRVGKDFANTTYIPYDEGTTGKETNWGVSNYKYSTDYPEIKAALTNGQTIKLSMQVKGRNVKLSINGTELYSYALNEALDPYRCLGIVSKGVYGIGYFSNIKILDYEQDKNRPNLKIGFISDVHIGKANNEAVFRQVLSSYKTNGVDLLIVNGDIGHHLEPRGIKGSDAIVNQQRFADVLNEVFPAGKKRPEMIITVGNHDRYAFEDVAGSVEEHDNIEAFWQSNFGYSVSVGTPGLNAIQTIRGYTFVSGLISTPVSERMALIDQAMAMPENNGKPVFYIQHEMPKGTLYITSDADDLEIGNYLNNSKYSNLVYLGGHSHNPLTDERSIWQGNYTVFTPCSLFGPVVKGANYYSNGTEKGSFQDGWSSYKEGTIVNVFDEHIDIERWDYVKNEKLGEDWKITIENGNINLDTFNYDKRTAKATAPVFQAEASIETTNISATVQSFTFDSCNYVYEGQNDIVTQYEIEIKDGERVVSVNHLCSKHYKGRGFEAGNKYTLEVANLRPGVSYDAYIYAQESFLLRSNPLHVAFKTGETVKPGIDQAAIEYDLSTEVDNDFTSFSNLGTGFTHYENALISNSLSSSKYISKNTINGSGAIEAKIILNAPGELLNAGLYVYADSAGNEQDEINAWNVELESAANSASLTVNLYRFADLTYKNCPAGTTFNNYFSSGWEKDFITLKVLFDKGYITAIVDGITAFTYKTGVSVDGKIGIRSFYSAIRIDELNVYNYDYTPDLSVINLHMAKIDELLAIKTSDNGEDIEQNEVWMSKANHNRLLEAKNKYSQEEYQFAKNKIKKAESELSSTIGEVNASLQYGRKGLNPLKPGSSSFTWMFVAIPSLAINVLALAFIIIKAVKKGKKSE